MIKVRMETIDSHRIMVELTKDDLVNLNITYEEMDYSNIETRRVIWTLLDEARRTLGCDIDPSGKLTVEAIPAPDGGCFLQFTVPKVHVAKTARSKSEDILICEFNSADDLLQASRRILTDEIDSELYMSHDEKQYRLIVYSHSDNENTALILSEHGKVCGEDELCASFTREHFVLVCEYKALTKLRLYNKANKP